MIRFLVRRSAAAAILLLLVLTATFLILHLAPGEPASLLADPRVPPGQREAIAELWQLDRPVPEQWISWLGDAIRGDWGTSFLYRRPVSRVIAAALPFTLLLGGAALGIQLLLGIPLGVWAARRAGGTRDGILRIASALLYSVPTFWLALMALALFAFRWELLPSSHAFDPGPATGGPGARFLDLLRHLILPAAVLGIASAGGWIRFVRAGTLQTLRQPHVLAARARGLSRSRILWAHVVRPSIAPWLQLVGLVLPGLLSGALVVEVVFSWPGLGRVAWTALTGRDYPLILACTAWSGLLVVLGTLVADVLSAFADPRLRESTE